MQSPALHAAGVPSPPPSALTDGTHRSHPIASNRARPATGSERAPFYVRRRTPRLPIWHRGRERSMGLSPAPCRRPLRESTALLERISSHEVAPRRTISHHTSACPHREPPITLTITASRLRKAKRRRRQGSAGGCNRGLPAASWAEAASGRSIRMGRDDGGRGRRGLARTHRPSAAACLPRIPNLNARGVACLLPRSPPIRRARRSLVAAAPLAQ